ncbi:hypothetical protein CMI37_18200 [Candidatus Pacearchaeota archaeon]|nr:hypothetical protein [Candidatus Pacearchaeota archaeon]|tara:strand:- start:3661 stop:3981 length:321 start_codon:yes stop_codon:yes gene_type:complete
MKLNQNRKLIKSLLEEKEIYRNDHERLIVAVWSSVLTRDGFNPHNMYANDFFKMLSTKKIPKPASIMRARRAIQQEIPSLRGISHKIRQDKQEEVKKEVKELRNSL